MIEDEDRAADDAQPHAANDNGTGEARPRIDAAVLRIARLIGRQMAREEFELRRQRDPAAGRAGALAIRATRQVRRGIGRGPWTG